MKTIHLARYAGLAVALAFAGCGGGNETSADDAARLLLDQVGECFAVAAGRATPDKFNSAAAEISSVPVAQVCAAWKAGTTIDCRSAYEAFSRPFVNGAQCKTIPAGSVTP